MRLSSYDEKLQEMRKHTRKQQEKQMRFDLRQKNREKEMAQKWVELQAEERRVRDQEIRDRLAKLEESQSLSRRAIDTDASPRQRFLTCTSNYSGGGLGGTNLVGAKTEAACALDRESLSLAAPDSYRAAAAETGGETSTTAPNFAAEVAAAVQEAAAKKAGSLPRLRKKKREEGATAAPLRAGGPQFEKSIMQQAQEQFQGLFRSDDGRAILGLGTKHQRMHREALVRLDPVAVEMAEHHAEENGRGEEEHEAEDLQQPTISNENGHLVRKYRLRGMRQITSQVLQCRRKMAISLNTCGLSHGGMGQTSQAVGASIGIDDNASEESDVPISNFSHYRSSVKQH